MLISKIGHKLSIYRQNISREGLIIGLGMNCLDVVNKVYYLLVFHKLNGIIDISAKIRGRKYIHIGNHFASGKHLWLEAVTEYRGKKLTPQIIIKDNVSFSNFNHIGAAHYVEIGNHVLFGSKCYVTDHNHGIYSGDGTQSDPDIPPTERPLTSDKKVIIEDNVWLGDNVTVLPGVTIGKGSVIGSNAVVSKSIPPYSIAVGIPARVIKQWNPENQRWEFV